MLASLSPSWLILLGVITAYAGLVLAGVVAYCMGCRIWIQQ